MAASKDDPVVELRNQRIWKAAEKKSVFHTFLQCTKKYFEKDNPGKVFQKYFIKLTEQHWKGLPDEQKATYRQLNEKKHKLIDVEYAVLDGQIADARPGVRKYGGTDLEVPLDNDDEDMKKSIFDPLFWYALEKNGKNVAQPH